ncbi:F0F1 ATP synthase subunit gamma [Pelagibaculum spongiae]|uniref:ATP synthase gamma chain n=1 Tax=Pelagibaculum spongiae TaxID=2080658 RepID=A0A2V1GVY6_9GAMM|nr:F0F1 ATP synthase subunit gamma [Pelagibaculum spongiae]PVZ68118.1 F0F1 ATP synthase subunit gamma [Pelagibaculum spongiae]
MAVGKEIRTQINSIKNTQKITGAMQMVAASKMRKTQARMNATRPYAQKIRSVIGHLAKGHPEYHHPWLQAREVKRVGYIVVSSDRGLCGGLNNNLFRTLVKDFQGWTEKGIEVDLCLIGSKANGLLSRLGLNVLASASHLGDQPAAQDLIGPTKVMLDAFDAGKLDQIFLVYNEFVNTMTQQPTFEQLLPAPKVEEEELDHYWDYIYEPDAKELMGSLLHRYVESQIYQGVVENIASEQAARMVAMKSASENAGNLIEELQLVYNKARQTAITQELSEIVSGAAAV